MKDLAIVRYPHGMSAKAVKSELCGELGDGVRKAA